MLKRLKIAAGKHGIAGTLALAIRRLGRTAPSGRFRGAFASYERALADVYPGLLQGYDDESAVDVCCAEMCAITPADEPVIEIFEQLLSGIGVVLDAGGHIGAKYRAFRERLALEQKALTWIVWDTPTMIEEGARRAAAEGLGQLSFIGKLSEAPRADAVLCSGLLQYLDIPFEEMIAQLPAKPPHLILNKVAAWDGASVFMLERIGNAEVPYHVRNLGQFLETLDTMGYEVLKEWTIPNLSHVIEGLADRQVSTSWGFHARLRT
jgi:putative methyltransferase (TIGR04325 family)